MLTSQDTSKKTFESLIAKDTTKKTNTFSEGDSHGHNPDSLKSSLQHTENSVVVNQIIVYGSVVTIFVVIAFYLLKNKFTITIKKKTKPPVPPYNSIKDV